MVLAITDLLRMRCVWVHISDRSELHPDHLSTIWGLECRADLKYNYELTQMALQPDVHPLFRD